MYNNNSCFRFWTIPRVDDLFSKFATGKQFDVAHSSCTEDRVELCVIRSWLALKLLLAIGTVSEVKSFMSTMFELKMKIPWSTLSSDKTILKSMFLDQIFFVRTHQSCCSYYILTKSSTLLLTNTIFTWSHHFNALRINAIKIICSNHSNLMRHHHFIVIYFAGVRRVRVECLCPHI